MRVPQSGWLHEPRPATQPQPTNSHGAAAQHLSPHAPLGPHPPPRGRAGAWPTAKTSGPRAVQHGGRRHGSVRQADGPQRPRSGRTIIGCCWTARGRPRGDWSALPAGWPKAGCSATAFSTRRCESAGTKSTGIVRWWPIWSPEDEQGGGAARRAARLPDGLRRPTSRDLAQRRRALAAAAATARRTWPRRRSSTPTTTITTIARRRNVRKLLDAGRTVAADLLPPISPGNC